MRFFNTAGPVNPVDHYCLPPLSRLNMPEIMSLVQQKKYFILHAPRQVGKTSFLLALMDHLNRADQYRCLYINVEPAQAARERVEEGVQAILSQLATESRIYLKDNFITDHWSEILNKSGISALDEVLTRWCENSAKPTVLLIDEIDSLVGDTLISVLRQLRAGYKKRPANFPQSIVLCGVRDIHDYRIHSDKDKTVITGGSAFNIKAESLRMGDFDREEVDALYLQHTDETGQIFEPEAVELAWELTMGQPWLVNALAYDVCFKIKEGRDRSRPITAEMMQTAKENLIVNRVTHLDQLADKLREDRVRRVISPMLEGASLDETVLRDDLEYVMDLGLIRRDQSGPQVANQIYMEVIPRELAFITQLNFESLYQPAWFIGADGRLDMIKLLTEFQSFFRQNAEQWVQRFAYQEAGPQLLLQAFLQRIVNGGGQVNREFGLGRGRIDLLVIWPLPGKKRQEVALELKIQYGDRGRTIAAGLKQLSLYMDRCGTTDGHLIIFDRNPKKSWSKKIFHREQDYQGHNIQVWGM